MQISRVRLAERPDLLPTFTKTIGLYYVADPDGDCLSDHAPETYRRLLENCPLYEISGGVNFGAAVESCMAVIQDGDH